MTRDRGTILINALVVVLTIAAISAALLARSEAARVRGSGAQTADQLELYLDAGERLVPQLLREVINGALAEPGQDWAKPHRFPIDRGSVTIGITDLQGRLNVNWLLNSDDPFIEEMFQTVFQDLDLPQSLLLEITDFLSPSGPRGAGYLNRAPPIWPRGGAARALEDLRAVDGLTAEHYRILRAHFSAVPSETRLNLNTAPEPILKAAIARLPSEVQSEVLQRNGPIQDISELRRRTIEILETEEIEDLQLDRLSTASTWFRAVLMAELEGRSMTRVAIFQIVPGNPNPVQRRYRWAIYD